MENIFYFRKIIILYYYTNVINICRQKKRAELDKRIEEKNKRIQEEREKEKEKEWKKDLETSYEQWKESSLLSPVGSPPRPQSPALSLVIAKVSNLFI